MNLAGLPRVRLAHLPTPLDDAPRLSAALGGTRLLIKRDDMTGLALGGNKARKLEFLLGAAKAAGATVVMSTAGAGSNYLRMLAAGARATGLRPVLFLRGTGDEPIEGNLLIDEILGADMRFIAVRDPWSPEARTIMEEEAQRLERAGERVSILTIQTTDAPLAAIGYVNAAIEIYQQLIDRGVEATHLFTATSSGITQAGLVLGARLLHWPLEVVGTVGTADTANAHRVRIADIVERAASLLGVSLHVEPAEIIVEYDPTADRLGLARAMRRVGESEGLILDPASNGRAMFHLMSWVADGRLTARDTVIFLHTGGISGFFSGAEDLGPMLRQLRRNEMTHGTHRHD
jgi:1-aminocyclopropane-1-carboxylate deaminase/D-cysteine desulfhydrase-like pyridoxal-dependent ACC family enzyme